MVLDIIIARLGIIAKPEQVVLLLGRGKACEISDILLLESEGDIEEKKEILLFFLFFLWVARVKVTLFSLGYINSHLNIRRRHWNKIRTINSSHNFYKSGSIRLR